MDRYDLHGLHVSSPLAVGLPVGPTDLAGRDIDLRVRIGPSLPVPTRPPTGDVLVEMPVEGPRALTGVGRGGSYVLRTHGMCDFLVDKALREVECRPDPSCDPEYLGLLIGGSLLAFVLGLAGECVLHASTVEVDSEGTGIAFAGAAGSGKSTLAGLVCAAGARLVADDLLRVEMAAQPRWLGGAPELRLRDGAVESIDPAGRGWVTRTTIDNRLATTPPHTPHPGGRLGAIVLPRPSRTCREIQIQALSPAEALLELAQFPRLTLWRSRQVLEAQFDGIWRIASAVPVSIATIPWGPPFPDGLGDELLGLARGEVPSSTR